MTGEQLLESYLDHVAQESRVRPGEPADHVVHEDPARRHQERFDALGLPRGLASVA